MLQRTEHLLADTERALVGFANEAGAARDYELAASLIELARKIKHLGEQFTSGASRPMGGTYSDDETADVHSLTGRNTATRRRNKLGQYPRFVREGESLIKIGWSKSDKAEYEHKSPKRVLALLCEGLTGANGKRITMEKVLPLKDPVSGSAFPDYQIYVCLAWLKSAGLVIQHGRQGYSLPKRTELKTSVETHWANLPTR